MLQIDIITLFPSMFDGPFSESIVGRAVDAGLVRIEIHDLRGFGEGRHKRVDDEPFGGGPGMVLMAGPLLSAVDHVRHLPGREEMHVTLLAPQGQRFSHSKAADFAVRSQVTLVCGHYEGVDQRFIDLAVDEEISIGDYVLTGGEIPAMALTDAVTRLLPGALGDETSSELDSFAPGLDGLLQGPVYTRPADLEGSPVPGVLLSGDHAAVERWRREQSVARTRARRPEKLQDWPSED